MHGQQPDAPRLAGVEDRDSSPDCMYSIGNFPNWSDRRFVTSCHTKKAQAAHLQLLLRQRAARVGNEVQEDVNRARLQARG